MKYLSSAVISSLSVLSVALVAGSASAAGITSTLGGYSFESLVEFNDGTAPGYSFDAAGTMSAASNIRQGTLNDVYAAPASDGSKYLVVEPTGTDDAVAPLTTGPIYFTSANLLDTFSFYWGSADKENLVEFFNGGALIQAFSAVDVFGAGAEFGSHSDASANQLVIFTATDVNSKFNQVKFSTGKIAFEFDAKPVPVPAIVPGIALAAAFFGSKALNRSKKNANESVA